MSRDFLLAACLRKYRLFSSGPREQELRREHMAGCQVEGMANYVRFKQLRN